MNTTDPIVSRHSAHILTRHPSNYLHIVTIPLVLVALLTGVKARDARTPDNHSRPSAPVTIVDTNISVNDKTSLHLISADGNTLNEEGKATGTLQGNAKVHLEIEPVRGTASSRFTLYLHGGTLSGRGMGKAHLGQGIYESFGGTMSFDGGTGRYAHASGTGNLYGALNRRYDGLQVQFIGHLHL